LTESLSTLKKLLNYILPLVCKDFNIDTFKIYFLGLILQERWFSAHGISKRTTTKSLWQIYDTLNVRINWQLILYKLADLIITMFFGSDWYLVTDGSPLRQEHAKYRITKKGIISVKEMKNVPHNELISLSLTNGTVYIPLDFRIWTSKKVTKPSLYKKKTDLFLAMMYQFVLRHIPIKTILFDNGFAAKRILRWLNSHEFTWITRLKSNMNVKIDGKKCKIGDLGLEEGESTVLTISEVEGDVKIVCSKYKDEIVYIATNSTDIDNEALIEMYKRRWKVEVFHREAKQQLGLENIRMRNWVKLQNHVGFVCLSYAILSVLRAESNGTITDAKNIVHGLIYQTHDAHERLVLKLAC
jgi:hypothetical protein